MYSILQSILWLGEQPQVHKLCRAKYLIDQRLAIGLDQDISSWEPNYLQLREQLALY